MRRSPVRFRSAAPASPYVSVRFTSQEPRKRLFALLVRLSFSTWFPFDNFTPPGFLPCAAADKACQKSRSPHHKPIKLISSVSRRLFLGSVFPCIIDSIGVPRSRPPTYGAGPCLSQCAGRSRHLSAC